MAQRFVEPSAVRTPLAPTAAHQPVTLATSPHQGVDARVGVHRALDDLWRGQKVQQWPNCLLVADVDECRNRSFCGAHAVCQNLPGSFQCLCDQGYEGARDGRHCVGTGLQGVGGAREWGRQTLLLSIDLNTVNFGGMEFRSWNTRSSSCQSGNPLHSDFILGILLKIHA